MSSLDSDVCKIEIGESKGREMRCCKKVPPGTLLFSEPPYIYVPSNLKESCHLCLGSKPPLMTCSACKSVVFCSKDCQRKAWKNFHKLECKMLCAGMGSDFLPMFRVLTQKITNNQPDKLFDDLITNRSASSLSEVQQIHDSSAAFAQNLQEMPEFGQHPFCDAELLTEWWYKLNSNMFPITDPYQAGDGLSCVCN
eukprot:Platyproteum_vivax@DN7621_c5_g2_i3.p1